MKSGDNKIVAGNLDIELAYSTNGTDWADLKEDSNVFTADARWEPGYTEVVYLKVKNAGSLALKYQLAVNVADKVIGVNEQGEDIDLSQYINFGVVEVDAAFAADAADRTAARKAVVAVATPVAAGYTSAEGTLAGGTETEKLIALVVYMPEDVDNEANYRGDVIPSVSLGISVTANQVVYESDSFGDDYNQEAPVMTYSVTPEIFRTIWTASTAAFPTSSWFLLPENTER